MAIGHCCSLILEISLYLFLSFPWLFFHHLNFPCVQFFSCNPVEWRLATVPWSSNVLILLAAVVTETSSSLEMVLSFFLS